MGETMPKLPLDPERLRVLASTATATVGGIARDAMRHPRQTATHLVSGSVALVGGVLRSRSTSAPTAATPPVITDEETSETSATRSTTAPVVVPDAAPSATPPAEPTGTSPADAEEAGAADAPASAAEEHLTGPAPHIPPGLAKDIERDFEEDIPGITPGRPD